MLATSGVFAQQAEIDFAFNNYHKYYNAQTKDANSEKSAIQTNVHTPITDRQKSRIKFTCTKSPSCSKRWEFPLKSSIPIYFVSKNCNNIFGKKSKQTKTK